MNNKADEYLIDTILPLYLCLIIWTMLVTLTKAGITQITKLPNQCGREKVIVHWQLSHHICSIIYQPLPKSIIGVVGRKNCH